MQLKNKNILLISPEPWEHIFVSKHHYATHLAARGNKVFFLNPPKNKNSINPTDFKNVWFVNYSGFIGGLRYFPTILQKLLMRKKLNQLQHLCNLKFDVVWSFDNSVFYNFDALAKSILKISHIVDLNQNFQTKKAVQTANICFAASTPILNKLKQYQENVFFLNHGYNSTQIKNVNSIILPGKNKTKALYAGNLDIKYLDWELIERLVNLNNGIDFIFAGNNEKNNSLFKKNNAFYIGIIPSNQLQNFYSKADVLLLCYKAEKYLKQLANPHKMMEYLGSGKIVVATQTLEYKMLANEELIAMTNRNTTFPALFKEVANNLAHYNNAENEQKRKSFANNNSYNKQIVKIEEIITEYADS